MEADAPKQQAHHGALAARGWSGQRDPSLGVAERGARPKIYAKTAAKKRTKKENR